MAGSPDSLGPSYISAHSADVILSEIRPTKLKVEALHSINVFLDEFLFTMLKKAGSLLTNNLRASLLSLLPTTLGKEALLEAEVELRAYWDRTTALDSSALEDDSKVFDLQWTFELLRLKCGAYSTLNEYDEDTAAENYTNDRMIAAGRMPPKDARIVPAALYLTAILEALCEHILSNVGRVVARDSSRSSATVQDLFIALCEDYTIYDLFKKMKVYEQIEQLSKAPKVRRSKSLTRNEKPSRTSSPQQDMSSTKESSIESSIIAANPSSTVNPGSRSSIEKTRTMKMFRVNSRSSIDGDVPNGHKRSNSFASVSEKSSKHTATPLDDSVHESNALQQEFDDLMRSSSTMKVSLTPDRLKTMEVYKQEKESGNRRPGPVSEFEISTPTARTAGRRPSLLHRVDSIKEDEEEVGPKPPPPPLPSTRNRQASVSARPTTALVSSRVRSVSTSGSSAAPRLFAKSSYHTSKPAPAPATTTTTTTVDPYPMQTHRHTIKIHNSSLPSHTRKAQRNRDSLDLDEVMGASDDDEVLVLAPTKLSARPATPRGNVQDDASANTKDLINFLSKGPPDMGGSLSDNTSDGYWTSQNGKSKGTGRLQKMISKLSLGNGDRSRGTDDISSRLPAQQARKIPSQSSLNNLSSLANRPVPPRPPPAPRPISPPDSPSDSFEDDSRLGVATVGQRKSHLETSNHSGLILAPTVPLSPKQRVHSGIASSRHSQPHAHDNGHLQPSSNGKTQQHVFANGHAQLQRQHKLDSVQSVIHPPRTVSGQRSDSRSSSIPSKVSRSQVTSPIPPASPNHKPQPAYVDRGTQPHISREDALDMHRLFSMATTADECRLILDMFLARADILDSKQFDKSQPPYHDQAVVTDTRIQESLLELLLGGEPAIVSEPA